VTGVELAAIAVCALPLCAAMANGVNALTGDRLYGHVAVARVAVLAVLASFVASLYIAAAMVVQPGTHQITVYRFVESGDFRVDFAFLLDPLSVVMMLIVTGISALVTHFSVNYMHNETGFTRYFTVVSLFVFAMLVLVMADNYLVMFLGWEGVGVCSYLLISFYRERPASAQAGTKAFVMNRVGDAMLLIAMFVLVAYTGTVEYGEVFEQALSLPRGVVETVGLLLLFGAAGKSAQLPFGTWLARAMEGPTPSSALMHAATMVTAGVYLVVRSAPIYDQAPTALIAVGIMGAVTALYGQLVGYVQTDIKGLLASSTTAQLGLMFVFCGLGLYAVAIFHLVAHAFYKSYLFLTAPSILHHLHDGADPTAVGRPKDTARLLGVAALAVAAGLLAAPLIGRVLQPTSDGLTGAVWIVLAFSVIAIFAAALSARRMTAIAFAGHAGDDGHGTDADPHQAHQASRTTAARLVTPLLVLAGLVALGVVLDILPGGLEGSWFQRLLGSVAAGSAGVPPGNPLVATLFVGAIAALLLSGWYGPRYLDRFREELPATANPTAARRLYWWALNRGYIDEAYGRTVVGPTTALGRALERFDRAVLDRPPPSAATPAWHHPATWEERFLALRSARATDPTLLPAAPDRLDWLPAASTAAVDRTQEHPDDTGPGMRAARQRATAWSDRASGGGGIVGAVGGAGASLVERVERLITQPTGRRGVIEASADAFARLAESLERLVFQPIDTGALKVTGVIAGITNAVERAVFQSGVERGVTDAIAGAQRWLLVIEQRLGTPVVIGTILALALVTLIIGTR
jgi:NADH-quinone oxidoreductase subunit L